MKEYRPIDQKACDLVSTELFATKILRPNFLRPKFCDRNFATEILRPKICDRTFTKGRIDTIDTRETKIYCSKIFTVRTSKGTPSGPCPGSSDRNRDGQLEQDRHQEGSETWHTH
jgi:hypothetical protein